jgi:hypothetical protein
MNWPNRERLPPLLWGYLLSPTLMVALACAVGAPPEREWVEDSIPARFISFLLPAHRCYVAVVVALLRGWWRVVAIVLGLLSLPVVGMIWLGACWQVTGSYF